MTLPLSEIVARAEADVGRTISSDLEGPFALAKDLTDLVGKMIDLIESAASEPGPAHVGAILLARLVTDLQACQMLLRRGYSAQALSLTAGMLELAHVSIFIGADATLANDWMEHSDPKKASPWSTFELIKSVAKAIDAPEAIARREYEAIYRQACMAKHGHPMALGEIGLAHTDDTTFILAGPVESEASRRMARAAMQYALRYVRLAAIAYTRDNIAESPAKSVIYAELKRLSDATP